MPEDLKFPFEYDESGDAASVDGEDFYYQHALQLALLVTEDVSGGSLAGNEVLSIESALRDEFRESPYFDLPIRVTIEDVEGTEITISVDVPNANEFELTV